MTLLFTVAVEYIIFLVALLLFYRFRKQDPLLSALFLFLGLSFVGSGYIFLLKALGTSITFPYKIIQIAIMSICLIGIVGRIAHMKKLFVAPLILLFPVISVVFAGSWEMPLLLLSSYLVSMAFLILFLFSSRRIRNAGFYGLVSVLISVLLILSLGLSVFEPLWFVPEIFLAFSFVFFIRPGVSVDKHQSPYRVQLLNRTFLTLHWKSLTATLIFVFLLNLSIFGASIGLHELGHFAVGTALGCDAERIVFLDLTLDYAGPYAEILCPPGVNIDLIRLGGFLFLIPFGLFFRLIHRFPERHFSHVVLGLSIVLAGIDVSHVVQNALTIHVLVLAGLAWITYGELAVLNEYLFKNETFKPKT